jgi:uncharacterized protein YukJ/DNA-binding response OmpR family regulator
VVAAAVVAADRSPDRLSGQVVISKPLTSLTPPYEPARLIIACFLTADSYGGPNAFAYNRPVPVTSYSLLKGDPQPGTVTGANPHFRIPVNTGSATPTIDVNVESQDGSEVLYAVLQNTAPPNAATLLALPNGVHPPTGIAIDYIRENLITRAAMTLLPVGDIHTLKDQIVTIVNQAIEDENGIIYAFGSFFKDPGGVSGIHDIHMNQGNPLNNHGADNGVRQDGALFVYLPASTSWISVYIAFQTQSWTTDNKGNPVPSAPPANSLMLETADQTDTQRILIVDDDPDVHELLRIALKQTGRYLESAFDGAEGLKKFEEGRWDLVITDVIMPKIDGMELLERILRIRPEMPVVVMTVASTAEKIVTAIRDHAFAWFRKPFTPQAVRDMVETAVAGPRLKDDIVVLSASPRWLELRLRCNVETAARALHFVREMDPELPDSVRENVALAFREILLNAVEHGGGNNPDAHVTLTYTRADRALLFRVRDPGQGFSFDALAHAAVSNETDSPVEHITKRDKLGLRPGGFGILLTRALVDELVYNEKGNEALLIKYLHHPIF